jgi:membrane associated rhomboid family serine protease
MYFFYYIPVGVDTDTRRFPALTVFFAATCVLVFVFNRFLASALPLDFGNLVYYPGFSGPITALTSAFLHFGYVHLIGNLVYMLIFGWYLEDRLGPAWFALLYLGSAMAGNLAQGWYNAHILGIPPTGIIGASGAVSGILGAFVIRLYAARVRIAYWVFMPLQGYTRGGRADVPVVFALALWVLIQVGRGLVQLGGASANVAHVTHIVGFLVGIGLMLATGGLARGRVEALRMRARRALRKADAFGARDHLEHLAAACPEDGEAHADLARVQIQTGDDLGAQANYLKACEMLLRSNQRGMAEDVFQEAVRGYPGFTLSAEPQLDLAFGLERNLKHEAALAAYRGFIRRFPRHEEAPFALLRAANIYARTLDDREQAASCYERLIEEYPEDDWVEFAREQARLFGAPAG